MKNELSKKILPFLNVTGPGDYDQRSLIGSSVADSGKKNSPLFSFGHKIKKPPIISKRHIVDIKGKDSPGVGRYNVVNTKNNSHEFSMGASQRFSEMSEVVSLK